MWRAAHDHTRSTHYHVGANRPPKSGRNVGHYEEGETSLRDYGRGRDEATLPHDPVLRRGRRSVGPTSRMSARRPLQPRAPQPVPAARWPLPGRGEGNGGHSRGRSDCRHSQGTPQGPPGGADARAVGT